MRKPFAGLGVIFLALAASAAAEPLAVDKVPEPLKPWVSWVLEGREESRCPFVSGGAVIDGTQRPCLWPARLTLSVEDRQGSFRQDWQLYKDGWAPLPGDLKRWPQSVQVDGRPAAAILHDGMPQVRLAAGAHAVSGSFQWDSMPELIQIPRGTGLVGLSIRGKRVDFPNRDEEGRLWLQKAADKTEGESRLEVVVHRRVVDDIPLLLATDIELKVSGKNREVLLGKALPPGFVPTVLSGPLPARLERDGRLRVQVRPGNWRLALTGRHEGPVAELDLPAKAGPDAGPWDNEEVWVFEAQPDLRQISVEGAVSVDPQQTELPQGWRHLPAYLMRPGDAMRFVERRRGDADPAPDQLNLARTWWLDFDGGGCSVRDQVSGTLRRSWRMEMEEPTKLGRVAVDGADQFITVLKGKDGGAKAVGIEIRQGAVRLDADSRVEGGRWRLPAVGWSHDFQQVRARLNMPPGWRIVHTFGVDDASPTWVSRWTLLDLFIVMMVGLAVGRLWDRRWGALALAALALCYHEEGAPRWVFIFLLICEALARVLPEGKLKKTSQSCRLACRVVLVVIVVPFLVSQVRVGVYPQLEKPYLSARTMNAAEAALDLQRAPEENQGYARSDYPAAEPEALEEASKAERDEVANAAIDAAQNAMQAEMKQARVARGGGMGMPYAAKAHAPGRGLYGKLSSSSRYRPASPPVQQMMNVYAPDPKARVSTGPGLPKWQWNTVSLTWRGPVKQGQKMTLLLVGPLGNFVLMLLRAGLMVLVSLCLLGVGVDDWLDKLRAGPGRPGLAAGLLALALLAGGPAAAADMPSQDMLKDLQSRLLRPAECEPLCASVSRLRLEAGAGALALRLEVAAGAPAALPLPGGSQQWSPADVLLDGSPARGLLRSAEGALYLPVGPGTHQVVLMGPLPDRDNVQIPLPLKPRRVETQVSGWTVDGVREDGLCDDNIQLTRLRGAQSKGSDLLQPGTLPPFVRVEREVRLGLSWKVETRVWRMTPPGAAVVLEVPLLPGESVTSADVRVEKGKVKLSMGPQVTETGWTSSLVGETKSLKFQAPVSVPWTEVWRLDASPIWHVVAEGIPVVHAENASGARLREWRPWPGETVALAVSRPEGVPGQTSTIDNTVLSVSPGLRATDVTLEVGLRSSRGGQHVLTLPEGAELQSLSLDGSSQPARQEKRAVTVPVLPGSHRVSLSWRQPGGIRMFYRVPEVKVGLAGVNSDIVVSVPADRWVLSVWGPRLGPAVRFWSALAVLLLVSLGLGRLTMTPLGWREWFLLAVGLSQVPMPVAALVAGWLLALGVRKKTSLETPWRFDLVQLVLAAWSVAALVCLFSAIRQGLLGQPDMQISGNGSGPNLLQWYQDRAAETLPRPWLFSLPRMLYRLAMLVWAMWIASSLLSWLRWGWTCINEGGLWKPMRKTGP
ncbi:MAG: hypothetical protein HY927_12665 [Elusimicrobia bacterium]|nr:hypothetical protein [Elusimicrobiota bacterium]